MTELMAGDDNYSNRRQLSGIRCPSHDQFCAMEMTKCRFLNVIMLFAVCFVNGGHGYELSIQEGARNEEGGRWQHDA